MRTFFVSMSLVISLLLVGCAYKPSAKFARSVIGEKVSTQVNVSMIDPENSVIIKDAVDAAVIERFKSSLTHRSATTTHLVISLKSVSFAPLQYDSNGYIISYRTLVTLGILRQKVDFSKNYTAKGTFDFSIEPNAIISDQARFDAIKFASEKAIDSFVAQVAAEGVRQSQGKEEAKRTQEETPASGSQSIQGYGQKNRAY